MNLMQPFREEVEMVSSFVSNTFDAFAAKIKAIWNTQHNAEGAHTDITADSIDDAGDLAVGGDATINGAVVIDPTDYATPLTVKVSDANPGGINELIAVWQAAGTATQGAKMTFGHRAEVALSVAEGINATLLWNGGGIAPGLYWELAASSGGNAVFEWADTILGPMLVLKEGVAGLFERGRSDAMGAWIAVAFSAGDYTSDTGTWTVGSGDVSLLRYTLVGKTMTVAFALVTTTVSGGQAQLRIKIPGGFTVAQTAYSGGLIYNDAGLGYVSGGNIFTAAGQTYIGMEPGALGVGVWTVSVNLTAVSGTFTFEVQ